MDSTQESRPVMGNRAAEDLAEGSTTSVKPNTARTAKLAPIGHTVEAQLDAILWKLILGEVELYQLTPALVAWWTLAHDTGRLSRNREVAQVEADRDRYYEIAFYGKDLGDVRRRRMDEASESYWAEFAASGGDVE